jgi:hypothetical protein
VGQSTNGVLAYGYDLGSEEKWLVREAQEEPGNEYGYLKTSWYDAEAEEETEDDADDDEDLIDRMRRRLYDSIPGLPPVESGWDCEDPVKEHLGVWFEEYCSGEYPMWILATHETTVYRGDTEVIDMVALVEAPALGGWDAKLAHALSVLELTPLQEKPEWLLASYWG